MSMSRSLIGIFFHLLTGNCASDYPRPSLEIHILHHNFLCHVVIIYIGNYKYIHVIHFQWNYAFRWLIDYRLQNTFDILIWYIVRGWLHPRAILPLEPLYTIIRTRLILRLRVRVPFFQNYCYTLFEYLNESFSSFSTVSGLMIEISSLLSTTRAWDSHSLSLYIIDGHT